MACFSVTHFLQAQIRDRIRKKQFYVKLSELAMFFHMGEGMGNMRLSTLLHRNLDHH